MPVEEVSFEGPEADVMVAFACGIALARLGAAWTEESDDEVDLSKLDVYLRAELARRAYENERLTPNSSQEANRLYLEYTCHLLADAIGCAVTDVISEAIGAAATHGVRSMSPVMVGTVPADEDFRIPDEWLNEEG